MAIRVRLNYRGFQRLRTSPEAQALIEELAEKVADAAGPGFVAEVSKSSKNRARATVYPDTPEAVEENAQGLTLVKALGAARK